MFFMTKNIQRLIINYSLEKELIMLKEKATEADKWKA